RSGAGAPRDHALLLDVPRGTPPLLVPPVRRLASVSAISLGSPHSARDTSRAGGRTPTAASTPDRRPALRRRSGRPRSRRGHAAGAGHGRWPPAARGGSGAGPAAGRPPATAG